jgi:REP element-mobilizing transposase RayT
MPALIGRNILDMMVESFSFCREQKGLKIYAYVIMENHFHMVAEAPELGKVMQLLNRHTAAEILRLSKAAGREWLLHQFAYRTASYKQSSEHQVWQEGFHPQLIESDAMLRQKIHYIHENPVRRGWVEAPEYWRYSSARNYILEDHSVIELDCLWE